MNKKNLYRIFIGLFLILLFSGLITAEERNIYIGDLINLSFSTGSYNLEELEKLFGEFEIVDSKELDTGYELTLRTFDPGEYSIILGDRKIEIVVHSTLDDIERDSIFKGDLSPLNSSYSSVWVYLFYVLICVLAIILIFLILQFVKDKQKENETPYQRFIRKLTEINTTEEDYFVKLTLFFKEYLEKTFNCKIRGKTSGEIIDEIKDIPDLERHLDIIREWLCQADYYKYTKAVATVEARKKQHTRLEELAADIEETIKVNEG